MFNSITVRAGVQSTPRFESGGTSGRPKIFLLEDWHGGFESRIPKLGNVLSRLLQDLRSDPARQEGQPNPSTLVVKTVLRSKCQEVVEVVKNIWRANMTETYVDGTEE